MVKVRVVRHLGRAWRSAPLAAHVGYLKRDGVDRSGGRGSLFDARGVADERAFVERCSGDRHHFRFIVSPEDAAELSDLRGFCRDLMRRMEADLGTPLDWIAVDHWNTAHPHLHVLVRGVEADGADLVIDGAYLGRGLRARAEALVSLELGPRSAREIAVGLEREAVAERWTRLDDLLMAEAVEGRLDLRPGPGARDPAVRPLMIARAVTLERLGLAVGEGAGVWRLADDLRGRLRGLAERSEIIGVLCRAAEERGMEALRPYAELGREVVLGRVLDRGLHDELSGRAYLVVDGVDGRVHHLRLPDLGAAGDTPVGGIVEARPEGDGRVRVLHRSDLSVGEQAGAEGATWLDRQLAAREPAWLAESGFGAEVRAALAARRQWLVERELATGSGPGWRPVPDVLGRLRRRELAAAGARLARASGLTFRTGEDEPEVRGRYVRRVDLASGRFAMVEDGLCFRLAPWARLLDSRLGQEVSGRVSARGVDWDLGRRPGLSR